MIACLGVLVASTLTIGVSGQSGARNGEWRTYGGDLASTRYASLDQINPANFKSLEVAWRFKTDNLGPGPEFNLQSTPLVANGVLYSTAGTRRAVVALDAGTGELLWIFKIDEGKRGAAAPRLLSGRGLAYWSDGTEERIIYVTPGYQMIALNAKTGRPVLGFGKNGVVDLKLEADQDMDLITGEMGLHAAPVVARDIVVVGSAHREGSAPKSRRNEKGVARGYDVRTGKRLWIFRTIPRPGEFGDDTWERDSWAYTGNAGIWGQITVDEELGRVYLPTEDATGDYYGGHRPGANLFSSTLVALDLMTGQRVWHQQLIHHDIWDWDIPCAPILADITVNGRTIKTVAQPTKQGWVYVFDRVTGQPVWPIEERPVPKGDIANEWYSPTQPFPTKPPAFDRQGVTTDDLIDFTPELRAEAVKLTSLYKLGPIFTPPVVSNPNGPIAMLMLPNVTGGANWQGGSYDPETALLYVFSETVIGAVGLLNDPQRSDMDYIRGIARNPVPPTAAAGNPPTSAPASGAPGAGGTPAAPGPAAPGGGRGGPLFGAQAGAALTVQGLPLVKPPYGRITAIDLNKGEIVWQVAHGETPDNVRNHAALKGLTIPRTGRTGRIGTLVTKTLLIAGEGGFFTTPSGQRGAMLRAYDKSTGREVGEVFMPAPQTGSPMTYMLNGKQHIVVAISGGTYSGELLAFRLPN
jgi:quinoprotein glucose dehydrogenase